MDPDIDLDLWTRFVNRIERDTNCGNQGIAQFFARQHPNCNTLICKPLAIHSDRPDASLNGDLIDNVKPWLDQEFIIYICQLCHSYSKIKGSDYKELVSYTKRKNF